MKDVDGKVIFVTGGSSGIGLSIARACAEAGMKVAIGYRTQANADEALAQLSGVNSQRVEAGRVTATSKYAMTELG